MSETWTDEEQALAARIASLIPGAAAVHFERQIRHRPAWFVDVARGDEQFKVYVRGDRRSDVQPFPELQREADIFGVLGQHGIPVPRIYGMCHEPEAIVMEAVEGTRDVATGADDEERRAVAYEYIDTLAAMHRIPVSEFAEIGLHVPQGADAIGLAGLDAYLPLYQRHKAGAEPLIELALRWLRCNIPANRDTASFITFDAGQFLFADGRMTAVFDLEFAMIGDPYADLASMSLREPTEPMGAPIGDLCRRYGDIVGEPFDIDLLRYHQVVFSAVSCMQFAGALANPSAGDPHDVYVMWDIYLRRCLVLVLAECLGVELGPVDVPTAPPAADALAFMVEDAIAQVPGDHPAVRSKRRAALGLAKYQAEVRRFVHVVDELALADAADALGIGCASRQELDMVLEARGRVADDAGQRDLFVVLARDFERRRLAHRETAIGRAADHARLADL